jgi:Uma2 family endonuclease
MGDRVSVPDYLLGAETLRRRELEWGVLRNAPAPTSWHQALVTRVAVLLDAHARPSGLGRTLVAPVDVVLDAERHLILQPDVVFISAARRSITGDQIWGPPDLVVEVLSPGTFRRDGGRKLEWYAQYGVRECWLVIPWAGQIDVHEFGTRARVRRYKRGRRLRSAVLPDLRLRVSDVFED